MKPNRLTFVTSCVALVGLLATFAAAQEVPAEYYPGHGVLTTEIADAANCQSCQPIAAPPVVSCGCGQQPCACTQPTCGCGQSNCRGCRLRTRPRRVRTAKCPQCDHDVCRLETERGKIEKSCYQSEQKIICIPKVRFPWQVCGDPCNAPPVCGKTKTIKVLKRKTFECDACQYKWTVQEPQVPVIPEAETAEPLPFEAETPEVLGEVEDDLRPVEMVPEVPLTETPQPTLEDVPAPPTLDSVIPKGSGVPSETKNN